MTTNEWIDQWLYFGDPRLTKLEKYTEENFVMLRAQMANLESKLDLLIEIFKEKK